MKTAVFAGSFDPITLGHIDIIKQALLVFDHIVIACGDNPDKKYLLPLANRVKLLTVSLFDDTRLSPQQISVTNFGQQLLVDFCLNHNYKFVIRGIRNAKDTDYEKDLFSVYNQLGVKVNFVYFLSNQSYCHISSSLVKGLLSAQNIDKLIKQYLTPSVCDYLLAL